MPYITKSSIGTVGVPQRAINHIRLGRLSQLQDYQIITCDGSIDAAIRRIEYIYTRDPHIYKPVARDTTLQDRIKRVCHVDSVYNIVPNSQQVGLSIRSREGGDLHQ